MKNTISLFIIIFFLSINLKAEQGCLLTSSSNTIISGSPVAKGGLFNRDWDYPTLTPANTIYINCPIPLNGANRKALNLENETVFFGLFEVRCRVGNSGTFSGLVYNFDVVQCPIDDYIPLMLLAAGGIGVFFLRRRNLVAFKCQR